MVPAAFHWRESLPLTGNSKIDKKALTALAAELAVAGERPQSAITPTERRVAAAWAQVLGVGEDQVGRGDHFFDRGGTSLSAVKLAIALDRAISLKDLTRHPVLADLAALIDGQAERRGGLLQTLAEPGAHQAGALVCFPYAGGNAVNFQSMASALRGSGLAVYAVELPGHDLAADREPFAPLDQVTGQVTDEIARQGLTRVLLWGHSSGAAFALETARKLEQRGVDVPRVFLAAQLPGDAAGRRAAVAELTGRNNAEIAAGLAADSGYTELGDLAGRDALGLDARDAEHVGAAYRHDCVSAHRYLADALDAQSLDAQSLDAQSLDAQSLDAQSLDAQSLDARAAARLSAPVTVVVAADDPFTVGAVHAFRGWERLAARVDLLELAGGGHYFLRTRPADAAQAVLRGTGQAAIA
jgi:surfactin synthase thioesterase subunit